MDFKPTVETLFWLVGGLNTTIVLLAFINKPIRRWLFEKFKKPEELQNHRIIKIEENQKILNAGVRALLADRLHQGCLYFVNKDCISVGDMANLDIMYREYKALGGNGLIKNMVLRVRKLRITAGDRCYGSHGSCDDDPDDLINAGGVYETSEPMPSDDQN